MRRIALWPLWLWGLGYGIVTGWLGIVTTGAGHGTNVLLGISSAPCSLVGLAGAMVGGPLFWAFAGWFISAPGHSFDRLAFLCIAPVHYGSAVFVTRSGTFSDWEYLPATVKAVPAIVLLWLITYLTGQAFLWYLCVTRKRMPNQPLHATGGRDARA